MTERAAISPADYLSSVLGAPAPAAAIAIADVLAARYPKATIFLYGSAISVSAAEDPTEVLFDYYVIAPDYRDAIGNPLERFAARVLPPNVYYIEIESPSGVLRAKYALLSVDAFERLVSGATFHSYFWARFAQPCRIVLGPVEMHDRMIAAVRSSIETFLRRSQGLADDPQDWREVWLKGMNASYRAELRAEKGDRAAKLIDYYGEWPGRVAAFALDPKAQKSSGVAFAWRARAVYGAFLSVARLLKASATFQGGIDYIAWKIRRHAGVDLGIKPWERRHPFIAAPLVAVRYYRMRAEKNASNSGST